MQLYKDQLRNKHVPFHKNKACCENNTAYIRYGNYWKKDTILNRLLSTSSWKNFTFLKTTWPTSSLLKERGGGGGENPLAAATQKTSRNFKKTKNLEKTKKTSRKPKKNTKKNKKKQKNKKNINSRLFTKLGCFTKTPWQLFFFGFLEFFLVLLVFSRFFWFFSVL